MMFLIAAFIGFLYPAYASYKSLSQRPASEHDLERWLMYWSVLGCLVGTEYLAEWFLKAIPFYSSFKTLFLIYLALPQTQGASYVYQVHLRPFFASHEQQIDQTIVEVRARLYRFLQEKARSLWQALLSTATPPAPPPQPDQVGAPSQLIPSLWSSYGPSILAGGAALLKQSAATLAPTTPQQPLPDFPPAYSSSTRDVPSSSTQPFPRANNPTSNSRDTSTLRDRSISGDINRAAEYDGYEVDGDEFVGGFVPQQQDTPSRTSWFGWGQEIRKDGFKTD